MKSVVALASLVVIGVAGCAATSGDPATVAVRECGYFARAEGARVLGVDGVDAVADGDANYKVRMQLEDKVARRMPAECLYSSVSNKTRWQNPLPSGFMRL